MKFAKVSAKVFISLDAIKWARKILAQVGGRRQRVYISGPITRGNKNHNLFQAMEAHRILLENGFAPLNPMLTMLAVFEQQIAHDAWLESDLPWVACADMVLRLPGESVGADVETAHAESLGIPVHTPQTFPWGQPVAA